MKTFIIVLVLSLSSVCYAYDTYRGYNGDTVDVEQPTDNTANVYINNQYAGSVERIPTSQDMSNYIDRLAREVGE